MSNAPAAIEAVFVDTAGPLAAAVEAVRAAPVVGFDTEFIGESTYRPVLCLLQLSTEDSIFVIDPLAGLDLGGFWEVLTEPGREVVALAARQELLFCLRYAGRLPSSVFDPQAAAGLVGFDHPLSHTNLVQRVLGVQIEGGEAYTDWRKRPLARRQLDYAADDVRYLHALRSALLARAEGLGRLDWLVRDGERLLRQAAEADVEERWRVAGSSGLGRGALGILRELWRWREQRARTLDLPPRRVLGDDMLVAIARRAPRDQGALLALRGMDRPALRRDAPGMLAAVQAGLGMKGADLPESLRRDDPPQVAVLSQLLAVLVNSLAVQHQVHASALATTADLQDLVRWRLGVGGEQRPALLDGWRGDILGRPLTELLDGRMVVRVADLRAPAPLVVEPSGS